MGYVELSAKNCTSVDDEEALMNCTSVDDEEALMGEEDGSMSTRGKEEAIDCSLCCLVFTLFYFFSIIFFMIALVWLVLVGMGPSEYSSIYIQDVYIPALDTNTNTNTNTTTSINGTTPFNASIFVDLKFQRTPAVFNVYSEDHAEAGLVVFYSHSLTPAANYRVPAFRMGRQEMVHEMAAAMEAPELPWEEARRAVSGGSTVELVVEFGEVHSILSGDPAWAAHVAVDASGHMVSKGPIKLS